MYLFLEGIFDLGILLAFWLLCTKKYFLDLFSSNFFWKWYLCILSLIAVSIVNGNNFMLCEQIWILFMLSL